MLRIRQLILPLSIITTLLALFHWFIFSMMTQSFESPPVALAVVFVFGWLMMPGALILSMTRMKQQLMPLIMLGYVWMGTFMIALFFACVQAVLSVIWGDVPSYWMFAVIPLIALWSLRINIFGPQIIKHKLSGPTFMQGLRIVQISDLHVGNTILGKKWLDGVVEKILAMNPDIVVVTGDLADGPFDETAPMLESLKKIKCQKFYVTGNHEYIRGGNWENLLKELGFEVLHNTHTLIHKNGGTLMMAGVPDRHVKRFIGGAQSDPATALTAREKVDYKILLAHEPSSVFDLKDQKCDLILSGHTHGGQIFPFAIFVRLQQPLAAGFKSINGTRVFAHQGTGFWGPPMRWFTRSEIVEFSF